jgi:uncharacterized membrane protein
MVVSLGLTLAALVALGACVVWAALHAPWARLRDGEQSHLFLGTVVAVALLWSISSAVGTLPRLHLLGATLMVLMFGPRLAVIGMTAAVALSTAFTPEGLSAAPVRALVGGVLPIVASHLVLRLCETRLPPNFFIYVFGAAFFGGAAAMITTGLVTATLVEIYAPAALPPDTPLTAVLLMLGFAEATLTGMLATLMAVYRPRWIGTFSDERYLRGG